MGRERSPSLSAVGEGGGGGWERHGCRRELTRRNTVCRSRRFVWIEQSGGTRPPTGQVFTIKGGKSSKTGCCYWSVYWWVGAERATDIGLDAGVDSTHVHHFRITSAILADAELISRVRSVQRCLKSVRYRLRGRLRVCTRFPFCTHCAAFCTRSLPALTVGRPCTRPAHFTIG
jgi:hypothetical protein